ncbi:MAG: FAD-dependent oxidoreductase [Rhodoferax sp.]|uniref:NAD(P)/FAD-dependent oxidoreductase n=1 Tax=Rhodoferax sp. TaxID=50421 RepID=UPI0030158931
MTLSTPKLKKIAVIGAGMAGVSCARTLVQAGHQVTLFEKSKGIGGRMATRESAFGTFDHGAQYFTVRDARFKLALDTVPGLSKAWSANAVQILDENGQIAAASLPAKDVHWVPTEGMNTLPKALAQTLLDAHKVELETRVTHLERDALNAGLWQLRTEGVDGAAHVFSGFDTVLLAIPAPQATALLQTAPETSAMAQQLDVVKMAPCWTLMLAFPQAVQPGLSTLGPQWNAARSTHHRIAWLARESSKPGHANIERWTVQASAAFSQDHLQDDAARVQAKLLKAFSEVTGIRAEPAHVESHRWLYAQTTTPLGKSHLWDAKSGVGLCGDWCLGHRVEEAFISGHELALALV